MSIESINTESSPTQEQVFVIPKEIRGLFAVSTVAYVAITLVAVAYTFEQNDYQTGVMFGTWSGFITWWCMNTYKNLNEEKIDLNEERLELDPFFPKESLATQLMAVLLFGGFASFSILLTTLCIKEGNYLLGMQLGSFLLGILLANMEGVRIFFATSLYEKKAPNLLEQKV
jgi:hypothetical protein